MKLDWKKIEYIIGHILYCLMNHQTGVVAISTLEARLCALALPEKLELPVRNRSSSGCSSFPDWGAPCSWVALLAACCFVSLRHQMSSGQTKDFFGHS